MTKDDVGSTSLHYLCIYIQKHISPADVINVLVTVGGNDLLSVKHDGGILSALDVATNKNASEGVKLLRNACII